MRKILIAVFLLIGLSFSVSAKNCNNEKDSKTADCVLKMQQKMSDALQKELSINIQTKTTDTIDDSLPVMASMIYYPKRNEIIITASLSNL